ncbi:peptidase inhibitor family I36 protein [Streptomyces massasporeus]
MDLPVRKRSLFLAGAALAASLPFVSVQPASAATVCPQGKLCTWTGANLSGTRENRTTPGHGCFPPQARSNSIRSLSNQSGKTITVYSDTSCYGRTVVIRSGQYSDSLPFAGKSISW